MQHFLAFFLLGDEVRGVRVDLGRSVGCWRLKWGSMHRITGVLFDQQLSELQEFARKMNEDILNLHDLKCT